MTRWYLDAQAAVPCNEEALQAYMHVCRTCWANPGSIHKEGQAAKACIADARRRVGHCFSVSANRVIFFSSATEALNTMIQGLTQPGDHIISSHVEHAAVWECCRHLQGREVTMLSPGSYGAITPEAIENALRPHTKALIFMAANNETGVLTDIEAIAALAQRHQLLFIVDGAAYVGKAPCVFYAGMSAFCFSSYKFGAPHGVGCAIISAYGQRLRARS